MRLEGFRYFAPGWINRGVYAVIGRNEINIAALSECIRVLFEKAKQIIKKAVDGLIREIVIMMSDCFYALKIIKESFYPETDYYCMQIAQQQPVFIAL